MANLKASFDHTVAGCLVTNLIFFPVYQLPLAKSDVVITDKSQVFRSILLFECYMVVNVDLSDSYS